MSEIREGHPIYEAIDRGGGQTCNVCAIIRELQAAGYVIVPREPTDVMLEAQFGKIGPRECWKAMIDEFLR